MITGIDHVIILADDLGTAIEQYESLGFTVTPGGKHPRFTHNALIPFADGTYLELIAFYEHPEPSSSETHRWHRHLATGGGLVDHAVGAADVVAVQSAANERGVKLGGPIDGARLRLDGIELRWRSVMPEGDNPGAIPFVIEDVTDRGLRVPVEGARHANGVSGIRSLVIAVRDVRVALERYAALLGRDGDRGDGPVQRDDSAGEFFVVGSQRVEVVTPSIDGPMNDLLDRRGDSVYELVLSSSRHQAVDPHTAANARILLTS